MHTTPTDPMPHPLAHSLVLALILTLGWPAFVSQGVAAEATPPAKITFEEHIAPILTAHCVKCHGGELRKAGLDLRRRFALVQGGDSGAAIVPGKPDESMLLELVTGGDMPPDGKDPLQPGEIELLRNWITAGAPTLAATEPALEPTSADAGVTAADRNFWAFRPPVRSAVPTVQAQSRVRTPIDAFLLQRLEAQGASFNPDAPKLVLLRRLYIDLIGLPPTPDEINAFLADTSEDAYERLVDRLLASPRYGERQARHWLDVAGYADSDGYLEADRLRPQAWRYRDYVIRALIEDKPYDRFVLEQIAGDELADWRRAEELTPELADNLIATGFLRTAADPTYPGYAEKLECYKVMADTVQIVSGAFLGLTVQCARCHSHKYDPISQRDYYKLHAVLSSSYDPARWLVSSQRMVPLATEAETARIAKSNAETDARLQQINARLEQLLAKHRDQSLARQLAHLTDEAVLTPLKAALLIADPKQRKPEQNELIAKHAPQVDITEEALCKQNPALQADLARLRAAIAAETALKQSIVELRALADLETPPQQVHILKRGDFNLPGGTVDPGVPAVLAPAEFRFEPTAGYKTTGRRMALAKWIVDPQHPTTARVHVNRVWAQHFGRGLVATLDNFGAIGERPSHPELLDWLATEFIARSWSQKALHRLLVTSTAYRQSSDVNARLDEVDPQNVLLGSWRPRRFEGEVVRDSLLAVSGKLNLAMYGEPTPVSLQGDGRVVTPDDPQGNRRSIYLQVRRSQHMTLLELFDTPRMEINCTRRPDSIVLTQALAMLNGSFSELQARSIAERILTLPTADRRARIDWTFQLLVARPATSAEQAAIDEFLNAVTAVELAKVAGAATPETQAAAERVAWTQFALTLLNSNEFVYVH